MSFRFITKSIHAYVIDLSIGIQSGPQICIQKGPL